jgi:hypothetical protein
MDKRKKFLKRYQLIIFLAFVAGILVAFKLFFVKEKESGKIEPTPTRTQTQTENQTPTVNPKVSATPYPTTKYIPPPKDPAVDAEPISSDTGE